MDFLNEPLFIKWYLSHDCNLNCKSCYISKQSFDEITQDKIELVLKVIKNIAPIKVSLLGGEPTIFPHFKYILLALEKEKIYYNFSTNGQTLYQDTSLLSLLKNLNYLKEIQVSIDGIEEENDFIRGKNTFSKAISSAKILIKNNIPLVLGITITKKNITSLQKFIDLATKEKVKIIRFIPFIPIGNGKEIKDLFISPKELKNILKSLSIPNNLKISTYNFENKKNTCGCGAGITTVVINSDLTISACDLYSDIEKTSDSFDSLNSFYNLWKENSIFNSWRTGKYSEYLYNGQCPILELYKEK